MGLDFIQVQKRNLNERSSHSSLFVCVEVLRPSQPNGSCLARSIYLTTIVLDKAGVDFRGGGSWVS